MRNPTRRLSSVGTRRNPPKAECRRARLNGRLRRPFGGERINRNAGNFHAVLAQLVERIHGKDEVVGSIPTDGSRAGTEVVKRGRL